MQNRLKSTGNVKTNLQPTDFAWLHFANGSQLNWFTLVNFRKKSEHLCIETIDDYSLASSF